MKFLQSDETNKRELTLESNLIESFLPLHKKITKRIKKYNNNKQAR